MKKTAVLATTILALTLATSASAATTGISNLTTTPTAEEILARYYDLELNRTGNVAYEVKPDIGGLTHSGVLTDDTLEDALNTLNFVRYIAGVPEVTLNDNYVQYTQDGSLLMSADNQKIHTPSQPSGMSDALYKSGYTGTSKGNISAGLPDLPMTIVHAWMADSDNTNLDEVGHRRWCLSPYMSATGFGMVETSVTAYSAMYVYDTNYDYSGATPDGVIWPARVTPMEYFYGAYPWSYSTSQNISGEATVTLTREGDGETWEMYTGDGFKTSGDYALISRDNVGGTSQCVIFRPYMVNYDAGDVFHVNITTDKGVVVADYTVEFMTLEQEPPEPELPIEPGIDPDATGTDRASAWFRDELAEGRKAGWATDVFWQTYRQDITRGEFVYLMGLYEQRLFEDVVYMNSHPFSDLHNFDGDRTPYLDFYVSYFYGYDVVGGTTPSTFSPDGHLTREQLATMLLRLARTNGDVVVTGDLSSYADAGDISAWALEGMRYMNQIGAINGDDQNHLNPQGKVTIEQAQAILYRFYTDLVELHSFELLF